MVLSGHLSSSTAFAMPVGCQRWPSIVTEILGHAGTIEGILTSLGISHCTETQSSKGFLAAALMPPALLHQQLQSRLKDADSLRTHNKQSVPIRCYRVDMPYRIELGPFVGSSRWARGECCALLDGLCAIAVMHSVAKPAACWYARFQCHQLPR